MQFDMIGLGRMGSNMVRRLLRRGHGCLVHDPVAAAVRTLEQEGAKGAPSIEGLVSGLPRPRAMWIMVPAGRAIEEVVTFDFGGRVERELPRIPA